MKRRHRTSASTCLSAIAACLIILSSCSPGAQAKQISGSRIIDEGEFYGWQIGVMISSQIEVEISGQNGSVFDVLIMDEENYSDYAAGLEFEFYDDYSALSVSNFSLNVTVFSGTVYIVVDNSDRPGTQGSATPSGAAEVNFWLGSTFDFHAIPDQGNVWLMYALVALAGAGLAFVVIFTRKALRQGRAAQKTKRKD